MWRKYGRRFGFGYSFLSWPYVGCSIDGLPPCWYPGPWGTASYPLSALYWQAPTREERLEFMKDQAAIMSSHLHGI